MTQLPAAQHDSEELRTLIAAVLNGVALPAEQDRLEELLKDDEEAQLTYLLFAGVHAQCLWQHQGRTNEIAKLATESRPSTPVLGFLGEACQGTVGYFSSGWPVAYLTAAIILGVGLLIGSVMHVSTPGDAARRSASCPAPSAPGPSLQTEFVGRITGMIDCQWADPTTAVPGPVAVPLGRKYALSSGLMEITYDTGAKVILQGPCTYEVESAVGGFLSVGKVTAKVEKRGEGREERGESSIHRSAFSIQHSSTNPQSLIPNPLFAVRTPTATVTDLGTEFGVEVNKQGDTKSHVFRGSVQLQLTAANERPTGRIWVLNEKESARVERLPGVSRREFNVTVAPGRVESTEFVRSLRGRAMPPRLVHLWTFDSDGEDCIGGRDYRLTFFGSATCGTSDSQIGAGSLSGVADADSYAAVTTYFPPDDQFTISAWIKTSSGGFNHAIFAWSQGNDSGLSPQLRLSRQFRLGEAPYAGELIYGQSGVGETWHRVRTGPFEINNGVWHHVAVTRARHKATLYIDGATKQEWTTYLLGDEPPTDEVTIGGMTFQPYPFCGAIDDVGYWAALLTPVQVQAIYNLGKHPATRYSQKDIAALLEMYSRGNGQVICGPRRWTVCSELPKGIPGSLVNRGNDELTLYLGTDAGLISSTIGSIQQEN